MSKKQLFFLFFITAILCATILYRLGFTEIIALLVVALLGLVTLLLEQIPKIRQAIDSSNLGYVIYRRRYPFLTFLNFIILPLARSSTAPKLYYLMGMIFGIVTTIVFFIEYSKKVEYKRIIFLNIVLFVYVFHCLLIN